MQDFARVFLHTRFCRQLSKNNIARRPKHGIGHVLVVVIRADENLASVATFQKFQTLIPTVQLSGLHSGGNFLDFCAAIFVQQ